MKPEECVPPPASKAEPVRLSGSPFEKMDSFVSLEHHKPERGEGEEGRVPGHVLEGRRGFLHECHPRKGKRKRDVCRKPCTDAGPRRRSPASGLFAGSFARTFRESVRWGGGRKHVTLRWDHAETKTACLNLHFCNHWMRKLHLD